MSSGPSRSSTAFDATIDAAVSRILDEVGGRSAPVVLVDGRSGSGKTTLATRLVGRWSRPVEVIALDDVYPGWDGLDAGVDEVRDGVLAPRSQDRPGVWRRWDWDASRRAEQHAVAGGVPLVVEGSGVVTAATARLADVTVWLESPDAARKARALARDGDLYRPHWERWAAQEEHHLVRDRPRDRATLAFEIP